jgi:hypothetical protein
MIILSAGPPPFISRAVPDLLWRADPLVRGTFYPPPPLPNVYTPSRSTFHTPWIQVPLTLRSILSISSILPTPLVKSTFTASHTAYTICQDTAYTPCQEHFSHLFITVYPLLPFQVYVFTSPHYCLHPHSQERCLKPLTTSLSSLTGALFIPPLY